MAQRKGIGYLGVANYTPIALKYHPKGFAAAVIYRASGWKTPDKFLAEASKRPLDFPELTVQMLWKDSKIFFESDLKNILEDLANIIPFIKASPNIRWFISGALEHKMDTRLATIYRDKIMAALKGIKNVRYLNSPLTTAYAILKDERNELHHDHYKTIKGVELQASWDGRCMLDSNVAKDKETFASAKTVYAWTSFNNGKISDDSKVDATTRPNRRNYCKEEHIRTQEYLMSESNKGAMLPSKDDIYKAQAETELHPSAVEKARAMKPVLILTRNVKVIEFKVAGQVVATFTNKGLYEDNKRYVYRCNDFGFKIVDKIKTFRKNAMVNLWADGKRIPKAKLHPVFRQSATWR